MNLAIVLTHNKGDKANAQQIETLKPLIKKVTNFINEYDDSGNVVGSLETYHYELDGLALPHEVKFYQIVPFGVTQPSNFYELDSYNVIYGIGDEDKIGDHPRFFNWGFKRATDNGAEIVVNLENVAKFSVDDLAVQLNTIIDPEDKHEYVEDASAKLSTLTLLKEVGQLDETKNKEEAINDLKDRISSTELEISEVLNG